MNRLLLFLISSAVIFALAFAVYRSSRQSGASAPVQGPMDISLEKLQSRNPGLTFTMVGDHARAFWVTDPASGKTAILPWQQSEDALVEFVPCSVENIPAKMLYPRKSTEPVCLRLTNEDGVLSAFSFHAPDRLMYDVAAFYDGPGSSDSIRGTSHEQTGRYGAVPDGSSGFLYSYLFYINPLGNAHPEGLAAFVGYKKEKGGE